MTYTEAAKHNTQFELNRSFRDPKQIADGQHHRWVVDPENKVGFVKGVRASDGAILVAYPIRALKSQYDVYMQQWQPTDWSNFKPL